jgi:steroid delta-isomerase-like uncharacterized protein
MTGMTGMTGARRDLTVVCALAVTAAAACSDANRSSVAAQRPADPAADAGAPVDPRGTWEAWLAAMRAHDLPALRATYAADAVLAPVGSGMRARGRPASARFHAVDWAGFPDQTITPVLLAARGNRLAAIIEQRGTHGGRLLGMPPTGRPVALLALELFDVDGRGAIARERRYADHLNQLAQLGLYDVPHRSADGAPVRAEPSVGQANAEAAGAIGRRALALLDAGSDAEVAALYAPAAVLTDAWAAADASGREAIEATDAAWRTAFPDLAVADVELWVAGATVVATYRLRGTHSGRLERLDLDPTGRRIDLPAADVVRVADGRIVRHWRFIDGAAVAAALGVSAPMPPAPGRTQRRD